MATLKPINDRQRQVLERIAEGSRPVTRLDSDLSTTVSALVNRRLVERRKSPGGGWIAVITVAGSDLLVGKTPKPMPTAAPLDVVVHEPSQVLPPADWAPPQLPPRFEQPLTYSVKEAAYVLGISASWLRARARARDFPHVRFGRTIRFTGPQLLEILEASTSRPLPNYYFGNPWGLVPRSKSLSQSRSAAAAAERTAAADSWGRPRRGRPQT